MNCRFELVSGEWISDLARFTLDFIQNTKVNLTVEGGVKGVMEGIPQAIRRKTWYAVIFDCFGRRELSFLDPIH